MQDCVLLVVALLLAFARAQDPCAVNAGTFGMCVSDEASCRGLAVASTGCRVRNSDHGIFVNQLTLVKSQNQVCCLSLPCVVDKEPFKCQLNRTCVGVPTPSNSCSALFPPSTGVSCCVQKACAVQLDDKLASGTCVPEGSLNCPAALASTDCPIRSTCCFDKDSIVVIMPSTIATHPPTPPPTPVTGTTIALTTAPIETSTSSVALPAQFPVAIVVGCVVGAVVLIGAALIVFFVLKKRRRADQSGGGGGGGAAVITGNTNTTQIGDSNRSQYGMISLRPPEVEIGAPYGSPSNTRQYTDLQMTPTTPITSQGYDVVPSEVHYSL